MADTHARGLVQPKPRRFGWLLVLMASVVEDHLHQFQIAGTTCMEPDPDGDDWRMEFEKKRGILISKLLPKSGQRTRWIYEYDFVPTRGLRWHLGLCRLPVELHNRCRTVQNPLHGTQHANRDCAEPLRRWQTQHRTPCLKIADRPLSGSRDAGGSRTRFKPLCRRLPCRLAPASLAVRRRWANGCTIFLLDTNSTSKVRSSPRRGDRTLKASASLFRPMAVRQIQSNCAELYFSSTYRRCRRWRSRNERKSRNSRPSQTAPISHLSTTAIGWCAGRRNKTTSGNAQ